MYSPCTVITALSETVHNLVVMLNRDKDRPDWLLLAKTSIKAALKCKL
jgi:hypothetical protein